MKTTIDYTTITLDPYVNGYGLRVFAHGEQQVNETHDEKLSALKEIQNWVQKEIADELTRRSFYAASL